MTISKSNGLEKQDWDRLQRKFGKRYAKRKISELAIQNFEEFEQWLVDQGVEISARKIKNELIRFTVNGRIGIVYTSFSGSLIAHDMAEKFACGVPV